MSEPKSTKQTVLAGGRRMAAAGVTSQAEKIIKSRRDKPASESVSKGIETTQEKTLETSEAKREKAHLKELAKEVDKIFTPKNFKGVVRAPADLMLATTGRKIWNMPDQEAEGLAETGALCAKQFVKADAKWLALILFSMALVTSYGGRAGMHYQEVKRERKEKQKPAPVYRGSEEVKTDG